MYFSVKTATKIAGKVYTPCVCYPLPDTLTPTIDKMVADGKAYKFENKVFFQNGKIIEKKPAVKENLTTEKPKKEKKAKPAVEEDVIPDNLNDVEGF